MAKRKPLTKSPPIITTSPDGTQRNVSTGIYQHAEAIPWQQWPQEAIDADNARWEALERAKQAYLAGNLKPQGKPKKLKADAGGTLAQLRQFAAEKIRDYLLPPREKMRLVNIDIGEGLQSFSIPSDAPPLVDDALDLLGQITFALSPKIDHESKLIAAVRIGQLFERLQVRAVEHFALIGRNAVKQKRKTAEKNRTPESELKKQFDAVQKELAKQARRGKRVSRAAAYKTLARRFEIEPETLKKNCQKYQRQLDK
jgi:hypothetical protein